MLKDISNNQIVDYWQNLYSYFYKDVTDTNIATKDIEGWNSSYNGEKIPFEEIHESIHSTVERIELLQPKSILDVGCGTGLILSNIIHLCESYWGTDFSEEVINFLKTQEPFFKPNIKFLQKQADDFVGIPTGYFDMVILNSVVQYFPNIDYLKSVIYNSICCLKKGGVIFIGDIRNLSLHKAYHASIETYKAAENDDQSIIEDRITQRIKQEHELIISPDFFTSIQGEINDITHVKILPKRGKYLNELTKFRYDVIIYVHNELPIQQVESWVDWRINKPSLEQIKQDLLINNQQFYGLRNVYCERLHEEKAICSWLEDSVFSIVKELKSTKFTKPCFDLNLTNLEEMANEIGYDVEVSWYNNYYHGEYDIVFLKKDLGKNILIDFHDPLKQRHLTNQYTNNPFFIENCNDKNLLKEDFISIDFQSEIASKLYKDTKVQYNDNKFIHQLFEEQASQFLSKVALTYNDRWMTYDELNQKANKLAHYLRKQGVCREMLIGICINRSFEMIIAILGILKAGGGYVPIDPSYPDDRIDYMLRDSEITILLTESQMQERLINCKIQKIEIDRYENINDESKSNITNIVGIKNIAYVIYTSGSTGKPKGVVVEHGQLLASNFARNQYYKPTSSSKYLLTTSISFDSSIAVIFSALTSGGEIIIYPYTEFDLELAGDLIRSKKVSDILCTPNLYSLFLDNSSDLAFINNIIVAGEKCSMNIVERHFKQNLKANLYNEYGPTECTVWSSVRKITQENRIVDIGKSISNVQIYILDEDYQIVQTNVIGEIYIAGKGVARGYLRKSDLTAERFIANPFRLNGATNSDDRLYKTGDLAKYLPDGNIEFIGRKDDQVKIRGYRIELGEIEEAIRDTKVVAESLVLTKNNSNDKILVAYIVPVLEQFKILKVQIDKGSYKILEDKTGDYSTLLENYLTKTLPRYMMPSSYIIIDRFPLTAHGKIDRKVLAEIEISTTHNDTYIESKNIIEAELCSIWQEVLRIDRVSINDNFFRIGGDSIACIQLVMKAKHKGIKISFRDVFNNPTILQLGLIATKDGNKDTLDIEKKLANENEDKTPFEFNLINCDKHVIDELSDIIEMI